ncbi:MAG: hypothetical protein ACXABY_06700 [Candidatus Thorarchaeota archaeon]|jgi:hypothetical protein
MDNETTSQGGVPLDLVSPTSGEETTTGSAPETQEEVTTDPSQEGEDNTPDESTVPFHEHPRFKELVEQKNQFSSQSKELQEKLEQSTEKIASLEKAFNAIAESKGGDLPDEYIKLMGDDEPAKEYFKFMQHMIEQGVSNKLKAQEDAARAEEQKQQKQREEWENVIDAQIKEISSEGHQVDRDELIKFASEHSTGGMLMDLRIAHKLMTTISGNSVEKAKEEKKANAGLVSSKTNSTPATADKTVSLNDVRKRSWSSWRSFTKD